MAEHTALCSRQQDLFFPFPGASAVSCPTSKSVVSNCAPSAAPENTRKNAENLFCTLERLGLSAEELLVAQQLATPTHIDEVCRALGMAVPAVSSILAMLEIRGMVQRQPGMVYSLVPQE